METSKYKIKYKGTLKNNLTINTTFEINFNKPISMSSEDYKSTEKEVREIIELVCSKY